MPASAHKFVFLSSFLKEGSGNTLFNDVLNTSFLPLYGIGHMV